MLVYISKLNII